MSSGAQGLGSAVNGLGARFRFRVAVGGLLAASMLLGRVGIEALRNVQKNSFL